MKMNEEDAEQNRCPLTMPVGPKKCIAADCMAWRWADTNFDSYLGYCGLAGKPL